MLKPHATVSQALEADGRIGFDHYVQQRAQMLPFQQAHALWLVDVCGTSYRDAAAEVRCSRDELAARVIAGRRALRDSLPVFE